MSNFFSFFKKRKDTQPQKLTLKQAVQQLNQSDAESIQNFAKVLSDYSDHSNWVRFPWKTFQQTKLHCLRNVESSM